MTRTLPRLEKRGKVKQLIVDDEPFIICGGELRNSSSSSTAYMEPIWPRLHSLNLNTVLAAVSWEMIEPEEGSWDFSVVDDLITDARRYGMRLVIIYFGTWKNATSSYVPGWVKQDTERFFRAQNADGQALHTISAHCSEAQRLDARAFGRLMAHIAEVDGEQHTVIMAQVENETGILGTPRDMCIAANDAFGDEVPAELISYWTKSPRFGKGRTVLNRVAGNMSSGRMLRSFSWLGTRHGLLRQLQRLVGQNIRFLTSPMPGWRPRSTPSPESIRAEGLFHACRISGGQLHPR